MKHYKGKRKFGRKTNQRHALLKSLAFSLIRDEKIVTTEAKAKELRPFIEQLITKAKEDSVGTRRLLRSRIGSEDMTNKLVTDIAPNYKNRDGGYTRITKLPVRVTDSAKMAHIEFV